MQVETLLRSSGSLRPAYEAIDWSATPLGAMSSWSPALRNATLLALTTRFPVTLFWGPEFVLVYNAAYVKLIAEKHPAALGTPARDVFPEAWEQIGPMMESVLAGRGATWVEDAPVPLHRQGFLEEAYFTFSYSPVQGADGAIEGVMDIAAETTRQVVDRRRLRLATRLGEVLADVESEEEVAERALPVLLSDAADLPAVELRPFGVVRDGRLPPAPNVQPGVRDLLVEETPAGRVAWLPLPGPDPSKRLALVALLSPHLAVDDAYLGFLRLIASSLADALERVGARAAERRIADRERRMSEALQRSLLTQPIQPDGLEIAVRYQPAAEQAHVGGDWYDAFLLPDGALAVVIGDVTGHDRQAAVAMAQVRNLLRGVSYTLGASPARVLAGLDRAMQGLSVDVYATAVVGQVEREADGGRTLRWCNAGHPPPILVPAEGEARLLETAPGLLLGLAEDGRAEHSVRLEPGAVVVFYTDGLVERRGVSTEERLRRLMRRVEEQAGADPEALCDHIIAQLEEDVEDDVALLVLRAP